jgi:hypothetical protein
MLRDAWVEGVMEWIVAIVFLIIVVYLVRSAASRSRSPVPTARAARSTGPMAEVPSSENGAASVAAGSPPTERAVDGTGSTAPMAEAPTSEDMVARTIAKFRTEMDAARRRMHEEVAADTAEAKRKIESANNFLIKTGVHHAVLTILKECWHYPSWSQRGDFDKHGLIDFDRIGGSEEQGVEEPTKTIELDYKGERIVITLKRLRSYGGGSPSGELKVLADGDEVFSAGVYNPEDAEYNVWRLFQLNGLVIGSWVATVVEIGERLNLAREKSWQNFQAEQIKKQAANLPT